MSPAPLVYCPCFVRLPRGISVGLCVPHGCLSHSNPPATSEMQNLQGRSTPSASSARHKALSWHCAAEPGCSRPLGWQPRCPLSAKSNGIIRTWGRHGPGHRTQTEAAAAPPGRTHPLEGTACPLSAQTCQEQGAGLKDPRGTLPA